MSWRQLDNVYCGVAMSQKPGKTGILSYCNLKQKLFFSVLFQNDNTWFLVERFWK